MGDLREPTAEELAELEAGNLKAAFLDPATVGEQLSGPAIPQMGAPEDVGFVDQLRSSGLLRGLANGATLGGSEALFSKLGIPQVPLGTSGLAAELVGGAASGMGLGTGIRKGIGALGGRTLANFSTDMPRLTRLLTGATEGAGIGGAAALAQGRPGDIPQDALLGAGFSGAIETAPTAVGALYGQGLRRLVGPKAGKKTGYRSIDDDLVDLARRENIPLVPSAVRPSDPVSRWMAIKLQQSSAAQGRLMELGNQVNQSFLDWAGRVSQRIGAISPAKHRETGVALIEDFETYLNKDLKGRASDLYDEILNRSSGTNAPAREWTIPTMPAIQLADQLDGLLQQEGLELINDPGANKIRRLAGKLRDLAGDPEWKYQDTGGIIAPGAPKVSFFDLWEESKKLYPSRRGSWTHGDLAASQAKYIVKDFIKEYAENIDPLYKTMFDEADQYWSKAKAIEESELGKALLTQHPEKIVDELTKDVTMLKEVRGTMGDEFFRNLAQRKVASTFFSDAVNPADGEISSFRLENALNKLGGRHGNIDEEYIDELLSGEPEVRTALSDLRTGLKAFEEARKHLKPHYEQLGGGAETISIGTSMTNLDKLALLVLQFATGGQMGKMFTAGEAANPLLGGIRPPLADTDKIPTLLRTLRRGAPGAAMPFMGQDR